MMNMPSVTVAFKERGLTAIQRAKHGVVALVFRNEPEVDGLKIYGPEDIPEKASAYAKEQIELCLTGYQTAPRYILTFSQTPTVQTVETPVTDENGKPATNEDGTPKTTTESIEFYDYTDVLKRLGAAKFDWCAFPGIDESNTTVIANWIKSQRKRSHLVKAVLPNTPADHEGVVNYTNAYVRTKDKEYKANDFCSRVAGIIAGTPSLISCTYAPVAEATEVEIFTPDELDAKVNRGEFFFFNDGERIKVARAVNSFVTTMEGKGEDFQKIKLVDLLDLIKQDIEETAHRSYIGKMANSEDNRALLCSAILGYFVGLELDGLLERGDNTAEIDIERVKQWRLANGLNTKDELMAMSDKEVKKLNLHDNVFIKCHLSPLDAVEDITINAEIE